MDPVKRTDAQWWGSVRKVRYLDDIFALVKFATEHDGRQFVLEEFIRLLKSIRAKREALRVQLFQGGPRRALRSLGRSETKSYGSIAPDVLAFAKAIGIMQLEGSEVVCPNYVRQIAALIDPSRSEAQKRVITLILDSKYRAYQKLLQRLQELGGSLLLSSKDEGAPRGTSLRIYLRRQGILTDSASFYTMRDLLYNLELLNWTTNSASKSEELYLTSALTGRNERVGRAFEETIRLQGSILHFHPLVGMQEFATSLLDSYSLLTQSRMGQLVQILDIREIVSAKLHISDQQFSDLLLRLHRESLGPFRLELSEGTIPYRAGLLTKAPSLPSIREGALLTYCRLRKHIE